MIPQGRRFGTRAQLTGPSFPPIPPRLLPLRCAMRPPPTGCEKGAEPRFFLMKQLIIMCGTRLHLWSGVGPPSAVSKNIRAACPPRRLQKSGRPDKAARTSPINTSVRFKASHALSPPPGTSKSCSVTPSLAAPPPAGRGAPNQRLLALPHMRADLWTSLEDHPRPLRGCFGSFFELGFGSFFRVMPLGTNF